MSAPQPAQQSGYWDYDLFDAELWDDVKFDEALWDQDVIQAQNSL